jgi:hypothetical protein
MQSHYKSLRNAQPWTRMAFPFAPYEEKKTTPIVKPLVRDGAPGYVGFGFSRPQDFPHSSGSTSNNTQIVNPPLRAVSPPPSTPIVTARRSLTAKGELPGMVHSEFPASPASTVPYTTPQPLPRKRERMMTPEASEKLERKIREAATNLSLTSVTGPNVGDKARRDQRALAREARKFRPHL